VVLRDLDVVGMARLPTETDSVLIIDPDAVLPPSITPKTLESIAGRNRELLQISDSIQLIELSARDRPHGPGASPASGYRAGAIEDVLRAPASKGPYHTPHYNGYRYRLKWSWCA